MRLLPTPISLLVVAGLLAALPAAAREYPIGRAAKQNGMEAAAVYSQLIEMDPPGMMRAAAESDVHLEADIKAAKGNKNGFPEGEWVPALAIHYELQTAGTDQKIAGDMMPMVANDGPHYGDNVKLFRPGKYQLTMVIA